MSKLWMLLGVIALTVGIMPSAHAGSLATGTTRDAERITVVGIITVHKIDGQRVVRLTTDNDVVYTLVSNKISSRLARLHGATVKVSGTVTTNDNNENLLTVATYSAVSKLESSLSTSSRTVR